MSKKAAACSDPTLSVMPKQYVAFAFRMGATYFSCVYVTGSGKTAHFAQYFKIELLVFKGSYPKAILCSVFLVVEVTCCGVLVVGIQSFLSAIFKLKFEETLIKGSLRVFFNSP